jgi:hypothetical protein
VENLHTRAMLERAFRDFHNMKMIEEERELHEGTSHGGMSAVISLTGWREKKNSPLAPRAQQSDIM